MDQSVKPIFSFVNLSHPDELKDEQTQLRIRRLAMTEVGRARRKPKTKRGKNEIVLKFRTPIGSPPAIERLGGGDIDPFVTYPIDMDDTTLSIVSSILRANSAQSKQLFAVWWPLALKSVSTFYHTLANARLYQLKEMTGVFVQKTDSLSLSLQNNALRHMTEMMKDPKFHSSDEMIASVIGLMCHNYILGNFSDWCQHRSALVRIVEMRGGIESATLDSLRILLSWADLIGAFSQDVPSIFPLPPQWHFDSNCPSTSPRCLNALSLEWKKRFPALTSWITIFDDINHLITHDRGLSEEAKHLEATTGCWMQPMMVRLLNIRPLDNGVGPGNVMEEVCRLGTMLFLAPIWRWLGATPVWTFNMTQNLLYILQSQTTDWRDLKPLLFWSVYMAALETRDAQERSQFAFILAVLMGGLKICEWSELMQIVKSVLWVDVVFPGSDLALRDEVLNILRLPVPGDAIPILEEIEG